MFDKNLSKKEKIILFIGLGIIILLSIFMEIDYQKAVETCIAGGQDPQVCETGLK